MKNAFKNTVVIAITLLYCFAVSAAGNGILPPRALHYKSSVPETETVSGISAELSHHIVQPALAKSFIKAGYPKLLKITFDGLAEFVPTTERSFAGSFSQYVKKSQNLLLFTDAAIIYPFHSFW